jgi:hypothetical protein
MGLELCNELDDDCDGEIDSAERRSSARTTGAVLGELISPGERASGALGQVVQIVEQLASKAW